MSGIISTLAKRLGTSNTSLKPLNLTTAKQRTVNWEPSLNFQALNPKPKDTEDAEEQDITFMATYSAFDPGATHPLLLRSAFLLPPSELAAWNAFHAPTRLDPSSSLMDFDVQKTPSLRPAIEGRRDEAKSTHEKVKTWPYALPGPLRPQAGTTWDAMYGDGEGRGKTGERVGVLQRVLYGEVEPGRKY